MKLKNEFKAIFELMNCDLCDPSVLNKFIIFRRKVVIEQQLIKANEKNSITVGHIDIMQVYLYEKLFQQYALYEYMTASAALGFWRELLSKNINAGAI